LSILEKYDVRVESLGSSSKGNSFYLDIKLKNKRFGLLIECGFKYEDMLEKLYSRDINIENIDSILVTHKHNDHSLGIKGFVNINKNVYSTKQVFEHYDIDTEKENVHVFDKEYTNKILYKDMNDTVKVFAFPLEHYDVKDQIVYNVGYVITVNDDFRTLFVIDTKYIKQDFSKYQFNLIFIETNYVGVMLRPAFEQAKKVDNIGDITRYNRVFNSHMSLEHAVTTLFGRYDKVKKQIVGGWDTSKTEVIILTHISSNHGANYQYYLEKFNVRKPKHIKVLLALQSGGLV